MSLKILSIKVRGLGTPAKCSLVLRELERLHYDLFLLQETHVSYKKQADHIVRMWPGECFLVFWQRQIRWRGVICLSQIFR